MTSRDWLRRDVRELRGFSDMTGRVTAAIIDALADLKGPAAAAHIGDRGVQRLHDVIDAREVTPLRDHVLEALRTPLLQMAVAVGRQVLGWDHEFYVDDYVILRVNFPFVVARVSDRGAENPGVGRLSPAVREIFKARKVVDPVYDPRGYHGDLPPAAWAHGPHCDSWAGHSRDGRNIWWAIGPVPADAGMVLYPELADQELPSDPRTLYLKAGIPLPVPTAAPLRSGEMLVFDPEVLLGTHLNTTDETRVAVSMRLNASRPLFDPGCFYAREFWRRGTDIEAGVDTVLHLLREENLGPPAAVRPPVSRVQLPVVTGAVDPGTGVTRAVLDAALKSAPRWIVDAGGQRVMIIRSAGGLRAYGAACPHYGLDLADGGMDDTRLYCPGCALAFDVSTGQSACPLLTLTARDVREDDGVVLIGPPASRG